MWETILGCPWDNYRGRSEEDASVTGTASGVGYTTGGLRLLLHGHPLLPHDLETFCLSNPGVFGASSTGSLSRGRASRRDAGSVFTVLW